MIKQLETRKFGAVLVGALTAALLLGSAGTSSAQGSTASADVTGTATPSPTASASPGTTAAQATRDPRGLPVARPGRQTRAAERGHGDP